MYLHSRTASSEHPAHKIHDKTKKRSCDMDRIYLHFRKKAAVLTQDQAQGMVRQSGWLKESLI